MTYRLSRHVWDDLQKILIYTKAKFGRHQANLLKDKFFERMDFIASHPESAAKREDFDPHALLRFEIMMRWYIMYRERKPLEIVRIMDARQDIRQHLDRYNTTLTDDV